MPPSHGLCRLPSRASLPSVESRFIVRAARGGARNTQEVEGHLSTPLLRSISTCAREVGCIYAPCLRVARSGQERVHDQEE